MNKYLLSFAALALVLPASAFAQVNISAHITASATGTTSWSGEHTSLGDHARTGSSSSSTTMRAKSYAASILTQGITRADEMVTARIASLNSDAAKVSSMTKLSASEQGTINATISADVASLTTLKAQIDAASSTSALSADIKTLTSGDRIYALVEPQIAVLTAADRVNTVATILTTLSGKITTRLGPASTASQQALLTDLSAKVSDAGTEASAAVSETASLTPDNGSSSVKTANAAALKDARTKLKAAQQDLTAAQKDARELVSSITGSRSVSGSANASTTASTTGL